MKRSEVAEKLSPTYEMSIAVQPFWKTEKVRIFKTSDNGRVFIGSIERPLSGWIDREFIELV